MLEALRVPTLQRKETLISRRLAFNSPKEMGPEKTLIQAQYEEMRLNSFD